ncbi:hypothetical protein ACLOJK_016987 [Asimina triloba]
MAERLSFQRDSNDENRRKKDKVLQSWGLPEDILFNILMRLPTLLIFDLRLVCKSWYNLITDPVFIETLLSRSNAGLIFQVQISSSSYLTNFMEIKHGELWVHYLGLDCPGRIRGSCNGLILLESMLNIFVFNPMTNQQTMLPPSDMPYKYPLSFEIYGFGYNSRTKEYKVVHICEYKKKMSPHPLACEITTVGSGSWREINGPFFGLAELHVPVSANGVLHWATERDYIISMDVGNEKFCRTPFPNCSRKCYYLLDLSESLSFADHTLPFQIDVWVLKDLNKGEWIKQYSVSVERFANFLSKDWTWNGTLDQVVILGSFLNGEIIIIENYAVNGTEFYMCDLKLNQSFQIPEVCGILLISLDTWSSPIHVNSLETWQPRISQRWVGV